MGKHQGWVSSVPGKRDSAKTEVVLAEPASQHGRQPARHHKDNLILIEGTLVSVNERVAIIQSDETGRISVNVSAYCRVAKNGNERWSLVRSSELPEATGQPVWYAKNKGIGVWTTDTTS